MLIESAHADGNWGDASMLHVAIRRISEMESELSITLMDEHSAGIGEKYANVRSVSPESRWAWRLQRPVWSSLDRFAPSVLDTFSVKFPGVKELLTTLKMRFAGHSSSNKRTQFLNTFADAGALVVSGGGFITHHFQCERVLNLILLAHSRDTPVFMFGQGIGPIRSSRLRKKAERALPGVRQIALREKKFSEPLLRELGVPDERIVTTGDDAVVLAHRERPQSLGRAIGVNLRVAYYSALSEGLGETLGRVLSEVAASRETELVPVPILHEGSDSDVKSIRSLLSAVGVESDGGADLNSPEEVIRQVGKCRVVVTGSYHAGVFALSQGVPVVGIANTEYYHNKFNGLADMFGAGCTVLRADRPDVEAALDEAVRQAWETAPEVRSDLLSQAERQIEAADGAYEQLEKSLLPDAS
nr:polysaccharide pyruvyl transferase family protein [Salinibacter sp.]